MASNCSLFRRNDNTRFASKSSSSQQLTRKHSPLLDSQECAKQDADYLENINRSSQEFSTALERFWEQPDNESNIADLENALRGITDVCYKGCPARKHLTIALDSAISKIERHEVPSEQNQQFLESARIIRHEQDETLRKLNLETAWTVLGRYRLLLHIHKKLAVNYIKNQAELLDISTRMDMEVLERGEELYRRILSKIKVKEESPPAKMPAYRPPEPLRSQPKSLPEPSLNPSAYADDVYSAIIRTKREDMFPEAIQVSALDLAYHITDSEALTARQKLELKGQLTHFKGKDPLNKLMYDRMPDEEQFDEFARQMKEAVDKGTVPDVHEIYSQTIK